MNALTIGLIRDEIEGTTKALREEVGLEDALDYLQSKLEGVLTLAEDLRKELEKLQKEDKNDHKKTDN